MASVLHNKLMKWRLKDGRRRKRFSIRRFLCLQDIWTYKLYSMGCNSAMNFPSAFFFEGERGIAIENLVFEPLASLARVFVPELQWDTVWTRKSLSSKKSLASTRAMPIKVGRTSSPLVKLASFPLFHVGLTTSPGTRQAKREDTSWELTDGVFVDYHFVLPWLLQDLSLK